MIFNKLKKKLLLGVLFSVFCSFNLCYADTLDTQISREKIPLNETINVSFILNGSSNANTPSPDFSVLEKDFRILSRNYGSAIDMINGVATIQTSWQLTLEPKNAGVLIIPEITFGNVKSAARKLIVEETNDSNANDKQDSSAFVQAEVSTTTPYIQSQVLYTFKLFYQSQLQNITLEIPQAKDATFVQLGENKGYQTTIKGKPFFVAEIKLAFFPQKVGQISIPPSHFRALAFDGNTNVNNPFYIAAPKTLALNTKDFTLNVQKIPDNYQGTSWLPAKNISITEKWSLNPDQWDLGNPVIRTITVEAQGLRGDQIPDLLINKISGMNMYIDPPKRSNNIQSDSVVGVLEQKVTYIPSLSQSFTIPAINLNWWNMQTNTNAVAKLNSMTVQVKGAINNTQTSTPISTSVAAKMETPKLIPNPSTNSTLAVNPSEEKVKTNPFYLSIWFWIAVFLFAIWLVTLWLIWIKRSVKNKSVNAFSGKNNLPMDNFMYLSDKSFEYACEQGDATLAQQYLLSWAKKQWSDTPLNLVKLSEMVSDENFKSELQVLEQAIYAKKISPWNGHALLAAYKKMTKQQRNFLPSLFTIKNKKDRQLDPLPPLNL